MHKKILLWTNSDQFQPYDYANTYLQGMWKLGANSGNAVFQYALQSILSHPENEVSIDTGVLHTFSDIDRINQEYDCVVFAPANIISEYAKEQILPDTTRAIQMLTIPCHAIGLGAQSDNQYSTDFLCDIQREARNLVEAILNTGGRIGVRGRFTAMCMRELGFQESDFTEIGCPSLFLNGPNVRITKHEVSKDQFTPAINGFRAWNDDMYHQLYLQQYPKAIFVCQDEFYKLLYRPSELEDKEYKYLLDPHQKWLKMYHEDRIKLYGDFPSWYHDMLRLHVDFSFGCRIHGNIVPILAGIPVFIDAFDSRVRELAEYFEIPHSEFSKGFPDPYELFCHTDYTAFNHNFPEKFEVFKRFIETCGIQGMYEKKEIPVYKPLKIPEDYKRIIDGKVQVYGMNKPNFQDKKIVFVTHEFGHFKGHGGIASCLYQLAKAILENCEGMEVSIISNMYDEKCDLLENSRFQILSLEGGTLEQQGKKVLGYLKALQPNYVETTEYLGLCLESLIYRYEGGEELKDTIFFADNHTATRECFVWSTMLPFKLADNGLQHTKDREQAQMMLVDLNMSPSDFLADYVQQHYALQKVKTVRHVFNLPWESKDKLRARIQLETDISSFEHKFVVSYITRFEGRKNQKGLVQAFVRFLIETGEDAILILAGNTSIDSITGLDMRDVVYKSIPEEYRNNIKFFDFVDKHGKDLITAVSDLAVMASTFENFPVAMTEYVYQGVPVMASKYSGCYDFMEGTKEYTAFDPFKNGDLFEKILGFYKLGSYGWEHVAQQQFYNLSRLASVETAVYGKLNLFADYEAQGVGTVEKSQLPLRYLDEAALDACAQETGMFDIILATKEGAAYADYCLKIYGDKLRTMSDKAAIGFSEYEHFHTVDWLVNNSVFLLPKLQITEQNLGQCWYEILAEKFAEREEYASCLRVKAPEGIRIDHGKEAFKHLYDMLFLKAHMISMDTLYGK